MRYAKRRDANDGIIAEALEKAGFVVHDFASAGQGVPDRLVTRNLPNGIPWICWVEIKTPKGKLRSTQETIRSIFEPRNEFYVARDPEATVREMMERYLLAIKPEHAR
jgi:hypothetical protein